MSTKDEALKLALEALEEAKLHIWLGDKKGVDANIKCHQTIIAIREALAEQPAPPPECKTDAEKTAFAFGWWKALEENRKQPAQQQHEIEELTAQRDKLADILTRTANALKGQPAELSLHSWHDLPEVAQTLKAAQQQEPHGWYIDGYGAVLGASEPKSVRPGQWLPFYTSPPASKPWVGLTDEEINACDPHEDCWNLLEVSNAIEAKLRKKNA